MVRPPPRELEAALGSGGRRPVVRWFDGFGAYVGPLAQPAAGDTPPIYGIIILRFAGIVGVQ